MEAVRDSEAQAADADPSPPAPPEPPVWGPARHPVLASTLVAVVVALGHARWIWNHRQLGAYDADEAGYVANALRFHDALVASGPSGLFDALGVNASAPLVPLLSVPLLAVGPHDARTALLVQPALLVVAAACLASVTRRFVGPWATIVATVAFVTLPTTIHAASSYWFGLGATTATAVAVWALLRSERATNRWIWVYGLAVAAVVLSRTMALAYVPALVGCGLVLVVGPDGSRRGRLRLGGSLAVAVALAAPWYLAHRSAVFDYLVGYGYGERAEIFGSSSVVGKVLDDPVDIVSGAGVVLPLLVALSTLVVVVDRVRQDGWRVAAARLVTPPERRAVLVLLGLGLLALASSANQGGWFTLPLFVALVPLSAEAVVRAGPMAARATSVVVGSLAVLLLAAAWWVVPYGRPIPFPTHYERPFSEYDDRFASDRRDEHDEAARDWDAANQDVLTVLRGLHDDTGAVFTVTGNTLLLNTNTLQLAGALDGWVPDTTVPETGGSAADRARWLTPTDFDEEGRPVERVLVVIDTDATVFTPDRGFRNLLAEAEAAGWAEVASRPLPAGGTVRILRPPS